MKLFRETLLEVKLANEFASPMTVPNSHSWQNLQVPKQYQTREDLLSDSLHIRFYKSRSKLAVNHENTTADLEMLSDSFLIAKSLLPEIKACK